MKIQLFDPPMCCPTGVCGPTVDPALQRIAADLDWLKGRGVEVERFNLSSDPGVFMANAIVAESLEKEGNACLPLTLVDGRAMCKGGYPTREMLAGFAGLEVAPTLFTEAVRELVAIGAAIASNCEMCFKYHYAQARKLGVSKDDLRLAVDVAQMVKDSPAASIQKLADKYLGDAPAQSAQAGSCCGNGEGSPAGGKCC
jgi:AhpD family alkylhydroperoxidase